MTYWKCPQCAGEDETRDDVIIKICLACRIPMKKDSKTQQRETVVLGNIGEDKEGEIEEEKK